MTDEEKTIRPCEFFSICEAACGGTLEDVEICSCYEIYKQLKHKEQVIDEIEEFCTAYSANHDTYETVYKQILDIISKSEEV